MGLDIVCSVGIGLQTGRFRVRIPVAIPAQAGTDP